jgi:hypothetical protein
LEVLARAKRDALEGARVNPPRLEGGGKVEVAGTGVYLFLGVAAASTFSVLALRWLVELRRGAYASKLPLGALDKFLAVAPVVYTVMCFVSAGALADRLIAILDEEGATAWVPLLGDVPRATGVWVAAMCVGLAMTTPPIVVFTVEGFFAKRVPELVVMGRSAVGSVITGVARKGPAPAREVETDEDTRWKRLLT